MKFVSSKQNQQCVVVLLPFSFYFAHMQILLKLDLLDKPSKKMHGLGMAVWAIYSAISCSA